MTQRRIDWQLLTAVRCERRLGRQVPVFSVAQRSLHGALVEITGFMAPWDAAPWQGYFCLSAEPPHCADCPPGGPQSVIEVFAERPIAFDAEPLRLAGRLLLLENDPGGYFYQLRDAHVLEAEPSRASRREFIGTLGALSGLAVAGGLVPALAQTEGALLPGAVTVDMHSHGGGWFSANPDFLDLARDMRAGGISTTCLCATSDTVATRFMPDGRVQAYRDPNPGETYNRFNSHVRLIKRLIDGNKLKLVLTPDDLPRSGGADQPGVILSAEGGDFLEGRIERVAEAHGQGLRLLQLTHYRVNELGDIQTVAEVHNGLTPFGLDVIRECNRLGIVVCLAHGTRRMVEMAAAASKTPLLLSHTSLAATQATPFSRLIDQDHARAIAATGGVVGIWPPKSIFRTLPDYVRGILRMVEAIGVDHVGIGSDMAGFGPYPSNLAVYSDAGPLMVALRGAGLSDVDLAKVMGGNFARVFQAVAAAKG